MGVNGVCVLVGGKRHCLLGRGKEIGWCQSEYLVENDNT